MSSPQTVSAIVAAYNEAKTVKPILTILVNHPQVTEVIAVDDGSTDTTWQKIQSINSHKLIALRHQLNLGKGAAIAEAVRKAKGEVLLFIDADLRKFHPIHIDLLLSPLSIDANCMTIGIRESHRTLDKTLQIIMKLLGGERAIAKKQVIPLLSKIKNSGYGVEIIINSQVIRKKHKIYTIPLPGLKHPLKTEKRGIYEMLKEYWREQNEVLKQIFDIDNLSQFPTLQEIVRKLRQFT